MFLQAGGLLACIRWCRCAQPPANGCYPFGISADYQFVYSRARRALGSIPWRSAAAAFAAGPFTADTIRPGAHLLYEKLISQFTLRFVGR